MKTFKEQLELIFAGRHSEALKISNTVQRQRYDNVRKITQELEFIQRKDIAALIKKAQNMSSSLLLLILFIGGISIITGLFLVFIMNRILSGPLARFKSVAQLIASGDLTTDFPVETRNDEIGLLSRIFQNMLDTLRELVRDTRQGVQVLSTSVSEIAAMATQVAASASETAAAISETTATVEEIRQTYQACRTKGRQSTGFFL